jgi:hypothetical protein
MSMAPQAILQADVERRSTTRGGRETLLKAARA